MRTIFRFTGAAMLVAVCAMGTFAQATDPCADTAAQDGLQNTIREVYAKDKPKAIETGKQLLEKFGTCEYSREFVTWLKAQMPKWEAGIAKQRDAAAASDMFKRFDDAVETDNYSTMLAAGKEILAKQPDNLNVLIPLALAGSKQTNTQPDETIRYAHLALTTLKTKPCEKIVNGKTINECGALKYQVKKENINSELNYALGYVNYWVKKDKKAALPFYYEAVKNSGSRKDDGYAYGSIGNFYADEVGRLGKEYAELVKTRSTADTPEVTAEKETKIKAAEGMIKGYLERAIDAFGRAKKFTPATDKTTVDAINKTLADLYKARFAKTDGMDAYVASKIAQPMPDPTSQVTPIIEAETTTTTGATTPAAAPATTTSAVKKPKSR
ncbi:MAG: hypothetical protein ABR535_06250 [Pyrinomonadaceae bacterium]